MKNIRYTVFLCLHAIAFSQAQNQTENISIQGEVAFGKYTDCLRPGGICTFGSSNNKAHANTQITYNMDNTITLIIDRNKMTKDDEYKMLGQHLEANSKVNELTFARDEDLVLENDLKTSLKIANHLTKIAKGSYPVLINEHTITITLKLE